MPGGTPYSDELFETICERIAEGESLRAICRDEDMPSRTAVMRWLMQDEKGHLVDQYTRARDIQADGEFDEILEIADDPDLDPQDRRVRIDTRKWRMGKMKPKKYGDKLEVDNNHNLSDPLTELLAEVAGKTRQVGT